MVHLTEKPVELARRASEYSSLPGEAVRCFGEHEGEYTRATVTGVCDHRR